ncbi:hypothetical protein BDR03DRAFT_956772, partial [Suillus americanus]
PPMDYAHAYVPNSALPIYFSHGLTTSTLTQFPLRDTFTSTRILVTLTHFFGPSLPPLRALSHSFSNTNTSCGIPHVSESPLVHSGSYKIFCGCCRGNIERIENTAPLDRL